MTTKIYWTSIEYSYDEKSTESKKLKGGFVYAFIKAKDVRDALEGFLVELRELNLSPVEIEFVKPYDKALEWETPADTKRYLSLFREAKKSTNAIFGEFYAFERNK
jgi:hypothetical protein